MLRDVRIAEKEWARRFSGRREAPRLGLGRLQFRVTRGLNRFACAIELLAYTAARTVEAGMNQVISGDLRQARQPSRSPSCVYRG